MSRTANTDAIAAGQGDVVRPFLVVELDYPDGPVRTTSLQQTIALDGHTYYGMGVMGQVGDVQEGSESKSFGLVVSVSGVPGDFSAYLQAQDVQGRRAVIRLGFLDGGNQVVGELITVFVGVMDTQDLKVGDTTSIEVAIESLLIDWERARVRYYTDADQQAEYPGDRGFEYVSSLQNLTLKWGK